MTMVRAGPDNQHIHVGNGFISQSQLQTGLRPLFYPLIFVLVESPISALPNDMIFLNATQVR
jgi:hypothetical protein